MMERHVRALIDVHDVEGRAHDGLGYPHRGGDPLRQLRLAPTELTGQRDDVTRAQKQAQGYELDELKAAVALCVDTDYAVKSGRLREEAALERAMLVLGKGRGA